MNSKIILKIDQFNPSQEIVLQTAEILNSGGVVVAPTETRYGLLAKVDNPKAIGRIYELKNRPPEMACSLFLKKTKEISSWANESANSIKLAKQYLPGPITLVLNNRSNLKEPLIQNGRIGIRISSSPFIGELLKKIDAPLSATSANISGSGDLEIIDEIFAIFGTKINLYLDSGRLNSLTSTVVDCSGDEAVILREGAISREELLQYLTENI